MIYSENILICIALPLLISLIFTKKNARNFVAFFIVGMFVCLLSAYISGFLESMIVYDDEWTAIYISPIIEEIMKLFPLLFGFIIFDPEDEVMTLSAVGLGTGFATFENCCYILSAGSKSLRYVIIRGMSAGVMHIVCIVIMIIGIINARKFKVLSMAVVVGIVSFSMIFHSLYNLLVSQEGISSYIGYGLPIATSLVLYIPYRRLQSGKESHRTNMAKD